MPLPVLASAVVLVALAGALASYRTTINLVAGILLLVVRPYQPGERVRLQQPRSHAAFEAEVVRLGLVNTTLANESGLLVVPNVRMLQAG